MSKNHPHSPCHPRHCHSCHPYHPFHSCYPYHPYVSSVSISCKSRTSSRILLISVVSNLEILWQSSPSLISSIYGHHFEKYLLSSVWLSVQHELRARRNWTRNLKNNFIGAAAEYKKKQANMITLPRRSSRWGSWDCCSERGEDARPERQWTSRLGSWKNFI